MFRLSPSPRWGSVSRGRFPGVSLERFARSTSGDVFSLHPRRRRCFAAKLHALQAECLGPRVRIAISRVVIFLPQNARPESL